MKAVLFCGGLGLPIRDAEDVSKPMVDIGYRPILWHQDFILCLVHQAENRQKLFRNYDECTSNGLVLSNGGKKLELFNRDIGEWRITFADTGINSNPGERLKVVEKYLEGEESPLLNLMVLSRAMRSLVVGRQAA
jgi:glucose-1-phosphate cytidylyltransferase